VQRDLTGSRDHNAFQVCTGIMIETDATFFVVDDEFADEQVAQEPHSVFCWLITGRIM
jgi:hypothetical protein